MLQISSGLLKGLKLKSPPDSTRPSSERLRQAIFNILRNFRWGEDSFILLNSNVTDMFAGSGAWGIEALSNGAKHCTFIESNRNCFPVLLNNVKLALSKMDDIEAESIQRDVLNSLSVVNSSRVIFCDPPYNQGFYPKVIDLLSQFDKIEVGGLFIYEAFEKEKIDTQLAEKAKLYFYDRKNYGEASVYFFQKR